MKRATLIMVIIFALQGAANNKQRKELEKVKTTETEVVKLSDN